MWKILFRLIIIVSIVTAQKKLPLNLQEIFLSTDFTEHPVENIEWLPNSKAFTYTEKNNGTGLLDIYKHDLISGQNSLLISGEELKNKTEIIKMSNYQWTHSGDYLLIEGPRKSIWRHSTQAPFYLLNVRSKEITALADNSPYLRNVKLSPDGSMVGYVRNHNIFIVDLSTGLERAITSNGTDNILNGEFDWVYEEEFGLADAWRWSPDSKKIAFWQLDQTRVKEFNLIDEMELYNKVSKLKYPKVGTQNSVVKIAVADLAENKIQELDLGRNEDIYIPRIFWTNSSSYLAIIRLNREQNLLEMLMANTINGKTKTIIRDTDPCWIDVQHDISFLKTRDEIIFSSENSGYRHASIYDYQGNLITQLTKGKWEITEISGVDELAGWLYFYGKKESPLEQHIYRVKLDGTYLEKISQEPGWHKPIFFSRF